MMRATVRVLRPMVARPRVAAPVFRRTMVVRAEAQSQAAPKKADASSGYLSFRFTSPQSTIYADKPVYMVQMSAVSGEMAVLGGHQPSLVQLKPGVVVVQEEASGPQKKWFVPAGFCVVKADNTGSLTASDVIPLEDLDIGQAKQFLTEQTQAANAAPEGSAARVRAQVGQEVYQAMVAALESK